MSRAIIAPRSLSSTPRSLIQHARSSLSLDGIDDVASSATGHSCTGAASFFCECWAMFPRAGSGFGVVISVGAQSVNQGVYLGISNTTRKLTVAMHGFTGITSPGALDYGRWYHVVFDWDASNKRYHLCVNGGTVYTGTDATAVPAVTAGLYVGKGTANPTLCYLHGIRLYKGRLLSQADCQKRMRGVREDESGLDSRVLFNDGYGSTAADTSGNGRNLTVVGGLYSPIVPFQRRRVVEDVAAAVLGDGATTCTVAHHADLDPAAGSWSLGLWTSARGTSGDIIAQKDDGASGWILDFTTGGALRLRLREGATTITVTGTAALRSLWATPKGTHRHVEITCDRTGGYAYLAVDSGPPARTALGALGSITNAADLIFGAGASGVVGGVNDAMFHKGTAWTWDQRDELYYHGSIPAGAISWGMREGVGTTVMSSPAGYDGALSAASWTTSTRSKKRAAA
jgi:hypothetical protein